MYIGPAKDSSDKEDKVNDKEMSDATEVTTLVISEEEIKTKVTNGDLEYLNQEVIHATSKKRRIIPVKGKPIRLEMTMRTKKMTSTSNKRRMQI
jgi:hypothetical protein